MKIDFQGQTVLITGATRGMGKQFADDFAGLGADLILTGTDQERIETLNREAKQSGHLARNYHAVDFTDTESTKNFIKTIESYQKIDVCINNAGINRINFVDDTLLEDWNDITAVNLTAPFLVTRTVSRIMKKNRYGRIVNIGSIFGVVSKAKRSIYSTTKFGLRGLTTTSAIELAPFNVLVNSVSPGFVLTELTKSILSREEMEKLAAEVPVGRFAETEEISKVVLFLASPLNTYLTGQNIVVDGGFVSA
jgi:3-oxoacyl-[acyl-carrier protein] reductase